MSGSPKYTTAVVTAAAAAALAAQAARRQEERRRAEQRAQAQRLAQEAARLRERITALSNRIAGVHADARRAGSAATADRLTQTVAGLNARARSLADEASASRLRQDLGKAEQDTRRLAAGVAETLARRDRQAALGSVRAALDAAPDRAAYDHEGADQVDRLLADATRSVGNSAAYDRAFAALDRAVAGHLQTAVDRQAELEQVRRVAAEATSELDEVLGEAARAGIRLTGAQEARAAADRLAADVGGGWPGADRVETARHGAEVLARANTLLSRELEAEFARLDRAQQVVEAAVAALPQAGFRVVSGSTVREGARVLFRAARVEDSSVLDIDVNPAADGTVAIGYHGVGGDYVSEQTIDGDAKRCDVTEAMLEKLHAEMALNGVQTDGLRWAGKQPRRISNEATTWKAQKPGAMGR